MTRTEAFGRAGERRAKLRECEERPHGQDENTRGYALSQEHTCDTDSHECQRYEPCFVQVVSTVSPLLLITEPHI